MFHLSRPEAELPYIVNSSSSLPGPRSAIALPRTEPIADFFPNVTVVFADISGFTAWSSEREPSQVFQLLETVYQAFDKIAAEFGVFKIETIGDCYVAVAGLPLFQPDHAIRIVKFAYECVIHMHQLTHELEATLGPSTSSLSIRVGVHSGPVIAGVLRGEKSRFQLFGDTMNTTARMQTTGDINRIQISQATANLLQEAKKSHWIQPRDNPVAVKGKGLIQTYWVDPHKSHAEDEEEVLTSGELSAGEVSGHWGEPYLLPHHHRIYTQTSVEDKVRRLVEWNTDLLLRLLKKIVAQRQASHNNNKWRRSNSERWTNDVQLHDNPLQEVTEILPMQDFLERSAKDEKDPGSVDIADTVRSQLQEYVAAIASLYRDNPFHNFEHASHVALSASKVVMRIIKPNVEDHHESLASRKKRIAFKRKIHNSTFGISSDVLMQFAVVFSAIIHDVDHVGVSNAQLVKEEQDVAVRYHGKCVAEQNSVDIAWNLLMQDRYKVLFQCICRNDLERQRFRQLLVNAVIATDIADKELQLKRKNRWDKAFHCGSDLSSELLSDGKVDMDRKATIVFEYIIQASDVAHTMQHWKVYKHWNENLFEERYKAYLCGREEQDPSIGWYKGEIWFFDNYIIPLAKKLETCGVFGVSSDEYLSYALENRHEWEIKGEEIVQSMVEKQQQQQQGAVVAAGVSTIASTLSATTSSSASTTSCSPNRDLQQSPNLIQSASTKRFAPDVVVDPMIVEEEEVSYG
jgi:class 3 adenylate cyclase